MQHGDELAGLHAVQALLEKYQNRELPRALSIFVGNVEAAEYEVRLLASQPDYNRIWPGTDAVALPEQVMMQKIVDEMSARNVFISLDIHNNTGINPHYACVNCLDDRFFHIATLFSRTVVYFTKPEGVQSKAFARLCPSVTVECGLVGQAFGDVHALEYIDACLNLSEIPSHSIPPHDMDLFHTVAIIKVPQEADFGFGNDNEIVFEPDLDHMNFRELKPGNCFGKISHDCKVRLQVEDNQGNEIGDEFFSYENNEITLKKSVMPSMLTVNERAIRQDCLGYLMERYPYVSK
jgi:succinylglutamate desuccinylase